MMFLLASLKTQKQAASLFWMFFKKDSKTVKTISALQKVMF
jgi:hypothetical protein